LCQHNLHQNKANKMAAAANCAKRVQMFLCVGVALIVGVSAHTMGVAVPPPDLPDGYHHPQPDGYPDTSQPDGWADTHQHETEKENFLVTNKDRDAAYDSYTLYRKLMDAKAVLTEEAEVVENVVEKVVENVKAESEGINMVKMGVKVILETIVHGILNGFLPTVERVRREATGEKRSYLDGVVSVVGAVMGKQECSDMIACRTGKWIQYKMPAAQLAVMMFESMVPVSMLEWFGVVKKSVIDRSDSCQVDYECSLVNN